MSKFLFFGKAAVFFFRSLVLDCKPVLVKAGGCICSIFFWMDEESKFDSSEITLITSGKVNSPVIVRSARSEIMFITRFSSPLLISAIKVVLSI